MQPIVNVSEEDRATEIGNTHKNLVKIARVVPEISSWTDRHIDRHILITRFRNRSRGRSNNFRPTTNERMIYRCWKKLHLIRPCTGKLHANQHLSSVFTVFETRVGTSAPSSARFHQLQWISDGL